MSDKRSASVAFIFVSLVMSTLGIGLVVPVMPSLIGTFLGGDLAATSRYHGVFVALYSVMQLVFAPILGALSDRFGRRKVLLLSALGASLDYVLLALAPTLSWFFVARAISGATGASFSTATAYIADVTPPEKRAQSFGLVGAAFGFGFVVGPAVGGLLGDVSPKLPFVAAASLHALNCLYGLFVLPESLPPEHRRPFTLRRANPLSSLARLVQNAKVRGLVGTIACAYLAQQILQTMWALYCKARYGWTPGLVGLSLTVVGLTNIVVQGGLIRVIMPRIGERRALVFGLLTSAVCYVGFAAASWGPLIYAIMLPFAFGGLAGPAVQSFLSTAVAPSEQGELQGSLASLNSVAAILAPVAGTQMFAFFTGPLAPVYLPGAPMLAASALCVLGLLLAMRFFAQAPESVGRRPALE